MQVRKWDFVGIIVLLLPALVILTTFFIYPIISLVTYSFTDWNGITAPTFVGFKNFADIFGDKIFWRSFRNSLVWAVTYASVQSALALLMATIISKKIRGWTVFRTIYFLPNVISTIAIATLWSSIYNSEFGLINAILKAVNMGEYARNWLGDPSTSFICVLVYGLFYIGYSMVIMIGGINGIDESYYEAATIDGADDIQKDWYITIPLIKPQLLTCVTLAAISGLRTFEQVFLLTNGGPANRSNVLVLYFYNQMRNNDFGGANASSIMLITVGVLVIMLIRLLFKIGERE